MKLSYLWVFINIFLLSSCKSDNLNTISSVPKSLTEISAAEKIAFSELIWVIEDSRNSNSVYGLNKSGEIIKELKITNAINNDWEDLTSDSIGNIYIGDFGNNKKDRTSYFIYKVKEPNGNINHTTAEKITFRLPAKLKQENFEAFFIYNNHFYIFNKEKTCKMFKVPNKIGEHEAELVSTFKLKGKQNQITSASISLDGKTVVLLNKKKLWKLTYFKEDLFFDGTIESLEFNHFSQKEGICFKDKNTVYITDERISLIGGNIYTFNINN